MQALRIKLAAFAVGLATVLLAQAHGVAAEQSTSEKAEAASAAPAPVKKPLRHKRRRARVVLSAGPPMGVVAGTIGDMAAANAYRRNYYYDPYWSAPYGVYYGRPYGFYAPYRRYRGPNYGW